MQELNHALMRLQVRSNQACTVVLRCITQCKTGQTFQNRRHIVRTHPSAQTHVAELDLERQHRVARDNAAHEDIAPATGVLGEGMNTHIDPAFKRMEGQTSPPGVVQGAEHAMLMAQCTQGRQIGKLHGDRTRRFQPHQSRALIELGAKTAHIQGIVDVRGDAEIFQLTSGKRQAWAVRIAGQQDLVALGQEREIDMGNGREPTGRQGAVLAPFQGGQTRLQGERAWGAVQAIGVAIALTPVALSERTDTGKDDGGGLVDGQLRGLKALRCLVRVVDQCARQCQATVLRLGVR